MVCHGHVFGLSWRVLISFDLLRVPVFRGIFVSRGGCLSTRQAFGTARVSLSSCSVVEGVHQWLQLGGRHIDTAHDYGTEPDVGEALRKSDATCDLHYVTVKYFRFRICLIVFCLFFAVLVFIACHSLFALRLRASWLPILRPRWR